MQNVEDAVVLVTGATGGMGKLVAEKLAGQGATVLLHGRSRERCETAIEEIENATGSNKLGYYLADLASLAEVRDLAERILAGQDRLDVLVNNAGVIAQERRESADGVELTFAVNYLSHFLLTNLLAPLLEDSAPARVVNVASMGQSPIDLDDVMLESGYDGMTAYSKSKLAQVMFTFNLSERLSGSGVDVNALHPATLMDTKMVHEAFGYTMSTVEEGAEATVRLAASPDLEGTTGRYFDGERESRADDQAYDEEARNELWSVSEKLCGRLLAPAR